MRIYFLLAFLCWLQFAGAQLPAEQALPVFSARYPVEKIYLQYDKETYLAGDHILFKAYVFLGYTLTDLSTNLYIELYDGKGELVDKTIVPLRDGVGAGSLRLESKLDEGAYFVRAYTVAQRPFNEPFLYLQQLLVFNPASLQKLVSPPVQWTARVYPESGSLLADVRNNVAVRLYSKGSLPPSWKGVVFERGDTSSPITSFTSLNAEVGIFEFVPQLTRLYQVAITDAVGNRTLIDLPPAAAPFILQTQQEGGFVHCKVLIAGAVTKDRKLKLIGQMNNQFVYKAGMVASKAMITASIPVDQLSTGILHFTLFNEHEEVLAERLQFVYATPSPEAVVIRNTFSTEPKGHNQWSVRTDSIGFNSLTVIVDDADLPERKQSMLSSLWLTNDVLRPVNNPAWYFQGNDAARKAALDALLITERWKWFQWSQVLRGTPAVPNPETENYLSYTGTVFLNRKPQLNKRVNLLYLQKDSSLSFQRVLTDSTGTFSISGLQFEDSVQVYYRLDSKREASNFIRVEFETMNRFDKLKGPLPRTTYQLVPRSPNDTIPQQLRYAVQTLKVQTAIADRYRQLEAVTVRARGKRALDQLNKKLSSPAFTSINERVFDPAGSRFAGTLSILDWVRTFIPGYTAAGSYRGNPVSFFLDEMAVDAGTAAAVSFQDIALVKFTDNALGVSGGGAALLLYTKRGEAGSPFYKGMPSTSLMGYRSVATPFQVDYRSDQFRSPVRDERQQLLWSTEAGREEVSTVPLKFYNSDITSTFRLTLIGFDKKGQPFVTEQILKAP